MLVSDPGPLTAARCCALPTRPFALDRDHQRDARDAAGRGTARAGGLGRAGDATARPGLAADGVLAVARRVAVSAGRSAVRLRDGCATPPTCSSGASRCAARTACWRCRPGR
ncbi:MAG: hypothetical protein MZV70_43165 [Desulfobacterales bacterium]|nr:hypothetical protein [Desulfobacterales bacterium]